MNEKILLKKYSNRRLYDTRTSSYVTLEDLTAMVKAGLEVEIVDAATKEDVTAFILTQVILEEARKKNILLPVPVLHLIIRHGSDTLGDFFDNYLQKTIQNYLAYRKAFDEQFNRWLDAGGDMSKIMPKMTDVPNPMETFMRMFMPSSGKKAENTPKGNEEPDDKEQG